MENFCKKSAEKVRVLAVTGPTATGKTALAVALAGGLYPLWALAVPLASPALYLILRAAAGRFKGAGK